MNARHDWNPDLPEPPAPRPEAREAALDAALARFEQKHRGVIQGPGPDGRLNLQAGHPGRPDRRSLAMRRLSYVIVTSVACLIGAATWMSHVVTPSSRQADAAPTKPVVVAAAEPAQQQFPTDPIAASERPVEPVSDGKLAAPSARGETMTMARRASDSTSNFMLSDVSPMQAMRSSKFAVAASPEPALPAEPFGRDQFAGGPENEFRAVREAPVSTFSLDIDTASYGFVRASLNENRLPQTAAVRTEELINYFPYSYAEPSSPTEPFRTTASVFPSPWAAGRKLIQIGVKGYALRPATRPHANLVFLIDTSGSMSAPNRLPLVKRSLALLVSQLQPDDHVAIVTYAGTAGTALEPTAVADKATILGAIEQLDFGGRTAGAEGLRQAYDLAERNFEPKAVNRVILATDGDFNVGITDRDELKGFIERQRSKGIFLSVLGFGMGNYNDALMQTLAQNGNGTAAYIDTINEARKVLVEEATSTLFPIAKDVKVQVEFNPATVAEYRLIGYETRLLNREDFANDKVDAAEVGSGQSVTALYEIVPVGGPRLTSDLRYATDKAASAKASPVKAGAEYAFVKIRYKLPDSDVSSLISTPVDRSLELPRFAQASSDARFATSVAAFGEILRGGRHTGSFGYDDVLKIASAARGDDPFGYRSEFLQLVRAAKTANTLPRQP